MVEIDRKYRRLRQQGALDAHRVEELLECVSTWARAELGAALNPAESFRIAVNIAQAFTQQSRTNALRRHPSPPAQRYERFQRAVNEVVSDRPCTVLTDLVWLLWRPLPAASPHSFTSSDTSVTDSAALRHHVEQLRSCSFPRNVHLHLSQVAVLQGRHTRLGALSSPARRHEYVCGNNHHFTSSPNALAEAATTGGCAYCSDRKPLAGWNTLADTHPAIAAEWDVVANGERRPEHILPSTRMTAYWLCPKGHSYPCTPYGRTRQGSTCVYCRNVVVHPDYNSLKVTHPHIAAEWHPTRNGEARPDQFVAGTARKAWWLCADGHEYEAQINYRARGRKCHYCSHQRAHPSTSLEATHPEIAAMWHPTLNAPLTPADVLAGSAKRVWWLCPNGHSYDGAILNRSKGVGCRYCANQALTKRNCLATARPHLVAEFHPTKNGDLTPETVIAGTNRSLWWICSNGHEWQALGSTRARGDGNCLYCANRKLHVGFNDLATISPALVCQFHPKKNGRLTPSNVLATTNVALWWVCSAGHEWRATGYHRVKQATGCRQCKNSGLRASRP